MCKTIKIFMRRLFPTELRGQRGSMAIVLAMLSTSILATVLLVKHQQFFNRNKRMKAIIAGIEEQSVYKKAIAITRSVVRNGSIAIRRARVNGVVSTTFFSDLGVNEYNITHDPGDPGAGEYSYITMDIPVTDGFKTVKVVFVSRTFSGGSGADSNNTAVIELSIPAEPTVKSMRARILLPEKSQALPYECENACGGNFTCPDNDDDAFIPITTSTVMKPKSEGGLLENGKNYRLTGDVNLSPSVFPVGEFSDITIDGNGYKFYTEYGALSDTAVFSKLTNSFLVNITFESFEHSGSSARAATIAGELESSCVQNFIGKDVTINTTGIAGGIAGIATDTHFYNVKYENLSIQTTQLAGGVAALHSGIMNTVSLNGSIVGGNTVGGITGGCFNCEINQSRVTGSVEGLQGVGGLVGAHSGSMNITQSTAQADVRGTRDDGGLVGRVTTGANITDSYVSKPLGPVTVSASSQDAGGFIGKWNAPSCSGIVMDRVFSNASVSNVAGCNIFASETIGPAPCVNDSIYVTGIGSCTNQLSALGAFDVTDAVARLLPDDASFKSCCHADDGGSWSPTVWGVATGSYPLLIMEEQLPE